MHPAAAVGIVPFILRCDSAHYICKSFNRRTLYRYVQFYSYFPEIVPALSAQSSGGSGTEIVAVLLTQSGILSWSYYRILLQVKDEAARRWYAAKSYEQMWSSRTSQRNASSQYHYQMLKTPDPSGVEAEMRSLTAPYQDKLEFIKNPVITKFLGMQEDTSYLESDLEQAIINNLQKFLMELGKGYAFIARQQRIHMKKEDYYIDLVFYNYILKCFVLIDLKIQRISHQDVGQMDMYVRIIARYSVLHGNKQLFASKYKNCICLLRMNSGRKLKSRSISS